MKQHHLRKEKNCLNCGSIVPERFCSQCGQENTEPKESFGYLLGHFFEDVTHYDSQLLTTLRDLIIKPGFLTRQYNEGKRLSYLNPIRMYIFISAVFFLVMFSQKKEEKKTDEATGAKREVNSFRQHIADSLRGTILLTTNSVLKDSIRKDLVTSLAKKLDTIPTAKVDTEVLNAAFDGHGAVVFNITETEYKNIADYNAKQKAMPEKKRDGWFGHYMSKKIIKLAEENGNNGQFIVVKDVEHDIPKIMFIFLPLFALIVRFFYSGKQYVYTQHAIFSLHFHSLLFIALTILGLIIPLIPGIKFSIIVLDIGLLLVYAYLVVALHNAYLQPLWLSAIKALAIVGLYVIGLTIGMMAIFASVFIFA